MKNNNASNLKAQALKNKFLMVSSSNGTVDASQLPFDILEC